MSEIESDNEEYNEKSHKKLLDGLVKINKFQNIKKPKRDEATLKRDEFHLVKKKNNSADFGQDDETNKKQINEVTLSGLLNILKKTTDHQAIRKQLTKLPKIKRTLAKPIEKPLADKIQRKIHYDKVKKNLNKWDAVVTANQVTGQLSFPLQQDVVDLVHGKETEVFNYSIKSDLMRAVEELTPNLKEIQNESEDSKTTEFPLTLQELKEKRREMARLRIKESYKIEKARRMNKIKSKKYHKIMKKEKIRTQMKEFEQLQKIDPEAALRKLEEIERIRVEERANLRHKNTGTWARNLQVRAKYDKDVRKELAQQLALSRELTQKQKVNDESSDENEEPIKNENYDPMNPWITKDQKSTSDVDKFVSSYRKYWIERNENSKKLMDYFQKKTVESETTDLEPVPKKSLSDSVVNQSGVWEVDDLDDEDKPDIVSTSPKSSKRSIDEIFDDLDTLKDNSDNDSEYEVVISAKARKANAKKTKTKVTHKSMLEFKHIKNRPEIDEELHADNNLHEDENLDRLRKISNGHQNSVIDPTNFITIKPKFINADLPANDIVEMGNDAIGDDDIEAAVIDKYLTIHEAFEDDDIVADFEKEKDDERNKIDTSEIDQTLPGWGSWGGVGIEQKKRPNKHFIVKMPKPEKRRDDNKAHVIINEDPNSELRKHLVSDVPFPFTSVRDYEASIRQPIGNTFVPETVHRVLTLPAIKTKMGTIIKPMNENELVRRKLNGGKFGKPRLPKKVDSQNS